MGPLVAQIGQGLARYGNQASRAISRYMPNANMLTKDMSWQRAAALELADEALVKGLAATTGAPEGALDAAGTGLSMLGRSPRRVILGTALNGLQNLGDIIDTVYEKQQNLGDYLGGLIEKLPQGPYGRNK